MLNDPTTPLSLLATRRSARPRDLVAPGPDAAQLDTILQIAARTPDHGKIVPWRFVIVATEQRDALARIITDAYRAERPQAAASEIAALEQFSQQAPALVIVLYSPHTTSHIPRWEQELSAGAVCMNLLHATHALGFAGGWLTGWPSYSDTVRNAFGATHERIAGFLFLGTPAKQFEERPRPDMNTIVSQWGGEGTGHEPHLLY